VGVVIGKELVIGRCGFNPAQHYVFSSALLGLALVNALGTDVIHPVDDHIGDAVGHPHQPSIDRKYS